MFFTIHRWPVKRYRFHAIVLKADCFNLEGESLEGVSTMLISVKLNIYHTINILWKDGTGGNVNNNGRHNDTLVGLSVV